MAQNRHFEFYFLRYIPNAIRGNFVNFGIIMQELGGGFADVRFARNLRTVEDLDPTADIELLDALQREIQAQFPSLEGREVLMKWLKDSYSNAVELSPQTACLTEDPTRELELLASQYLDEPQKFHGVKHARSGRGMILDKMQFEFERVGVWELLIRGVPAADYATGDTFKFDFGYSIGGKLKMFHAVSMKTSVNGAIELASKYKKISPLIAARRESSPSLMAVIEDDVVHEEERNAYTLGAMRADGIRIARLSEMPGIAEVVQMELRA